MTSTPDPPVGADGPWPDPPPHVVRAAGGVVVRDGATDRCGDARPEVLVVHRPRYDDWSFPKGKLEPGESFAAGALREVEEETGLRCELGEPIDQVEYVDHKRRQKVVRYWVMRVVEGHGQEFAANDEVDVVEWLPLDEAENRLTYRHDVRVLRRLPPG